MAATLAAFATSSPELTVSVTAALSGLPQIALGDSLGSNVVNVALILSVVLLIGPVPAPRDAIRRDFVVALLIPLATVLLLLDGRLSRLEGAALLGLFALWTSAVIVASLRQRAASAPPEVQGRVHVPAFASLAGLLLLVAAGRLIVHAASGIAADLGLSQFVVGAVVIAIGTSIPELATAVIAKIRGHDEVGLGTLLGSNIFNGLLIVGVASAIEPIRIAAGEALPALLFGCLALILAYPDRNGVISRWRGAALALLYVVYVFVISL